MDIEIGKVYEWTELIKMNYPLKRFHKEDGKVGLNRLASKHFHDKTYFEGITFELLQHTTKFKALDNNYSKMKVWRFITIRNIEWEIERLENFIWTLKFEFKTLDVIKEEELRLQVLRCRLLEVLRGRVMV